MLPRKPPKLSIRPSSPPTASRWDVNPPSRWHTEPTAQQKRVWDWMIAYQRSHCMPPSIRETCEHFNFKSTQAAVCHLRALVRKGLVMHVGKASRSRSLLAIFPDDRCPSCGRKPMGQTEFARRINEPDPGLELAGSVPVVTYRDIIQARLDAEAKLEPES